MRGMRKRISWKMRLLAWFLVVAMVSGNLSQVGYAAQSQTKETTEQRVIKITEKEIERILDRDPERRPELELKDIPFKGETKKQNVLDEILSLTEGKILIKKQRNGASLCLIYAEKDGLDIDFYDEDAEVDEDECLIDFLEIYTVNAGDKPVEYKVVLDSDTMVIGEATSSEFKVVGDNEDFTIATDSNAVKATDSNASAQEKETEAPAAQPDNGQAGESGQENTTQDPAQGDNGQNPAEGTEGEAPAGGADQQEPAENGGAETPSEETGSQESQETQAQPETESQTETEAEKEPETEAPAAEPTEKETEKEPEADEPQELSRSVRERYLVTSSDDDEEDEGAGLVSLSFDEDATEEVMESLQEEGGIVSRVGAGMIKSTRLTLVPSTPFFEAVTEALGDPDSAEDNQVVVGSIAVSPDKTGEIMAGEEFHLTVNYAMNAVPPYSYNGGTVSLYTPNEVKRGTIILTVPRELVLPQQAVYRQEAGESAIYNIPVSDESASGKMVLKAYFAGNGRSGIGTAYEMSNIWSAAYSGFVTAVDPTDASSSVEYAFCDYGQRESLDEELTEEMYQWELASPDVWAVNKEITSLNGVGEQVSLNGQDAVKFEFEITVGLDQAGAPAVGDANYFRPGRVPFESYRLTDTLTLHDKEGNPTDIAPLKVELVPEGANNGSPLVAEEPVLNSAVISTEQYAAAGHPGEDTGLYETDGSAPALTRYKVTAYYARENFKLDFWDPQVEDGATYQVKNDVTIDYTLANVNGGGNRPQIQDDARGYYQFVEGSSAIRLKKNLLIPDLNEAGELTTREVPFDGVYGGYYEGYAGFTLEKQDEEGTFQVYSPKVLEGGVYKDLENIAINPVQDSLDGEVPEQGTDGSLTFYVEPGTYRITETELPEKTQPGPGMELDSRGQAYFEVTVKLDDEKTVTFKNAVQSGGLQFAKYGYEYRNHGLSEKADPLGGVTFELFDGQGESLGSATSGKDGIVSFFPLDAGTYTLKEVSTADGYILDSTAYDVKVEAGRIARPRKGGADQEVLYNLPNQSAVRVVKWLAKPGQEQETRVQLGGQAVEAFAGRFQVEYRDGENWLKYGDPLSLGGSGEIYLDLPVYRNEKTESAEATVYRVVESVPEAYTSKTYNVGDGAYYQTFDPDARQVVSREFTLEEAREQGKPAPVQTINITNIPRSNIALTKYNAGYGASGDDRKSWITSEKAGAAAAEFQLLRKTGEGRYDLVGSGQTDENGNIVFSNLDIWTDNGSKIEYYWYEMPQSGTRLEVFDSEYASGSENRLQTVTGAVIDGVSYDAVMLGGPFELTVDSTVRAYAYNVAQKLPVWIEKRDGSAKETVIWTDSDPETQFEFTIYQMDGDKTGAAGQPVTVRNDGKPVYLDLGYQYKVYETKHPESYEGYEGQESQSDEKGFYQIIDLTKRPEISMGSGVQEAKGGNLTTFVNRRLSRLQVVKQSRTIDLNDLLTKDSRLTDVEFEVFTEEDGQFKSTGRTIKSDDGNYWFKAGTYYVKEKSVPAGHIDPATYLETGDHRKDDDLKYFMDSGRQNLYYGPIQVEESGKEVATGSVEVINYKNVGTIRAIKKSGNTGDPLGGAVIALEKLAGVKYVEIGRQTSDKETGFVTFGGVAIYDDNGDKITYRLREITPPSGYTLDKGREYAVQLDQKDLLTTVDTTGHTLEFVNNLAVNLTVRKFWTDKWESQFDHRDIKNELPGVDLVLYKWDQTGGAGKAQLVAAGASDEAAAAAMFKGLDSKLAYFVVEGEGVSGYEPKDGKVILTKTSGAYPEELDVSADGALMGGDYNYVFFPVQAAGEIEVNRSGEILNERPWLQFNLHKYADRVLYNENTENRTPVTFEYEGTSHTFYAEELNPHKDVNGARFEFHETPLAGGLEAVLDGGTLIDVYETGTKLNGLGGQQVDGEFDTTIVRPGNIFWLKEVSAGPGYSWGDRPQIIAFVPADQLGSFELDENGFYVRADETKVKVVPYEKNATVTADAFNYDMSGTGIGEINTAYVKLNKWLETERDGQKEYTPLGGVTFQLRVGGITVATLETGLDNQWNGGDKTGQAMSEMLYFDRIVEALKSAGRTDEEILKWVNFETHEISFELVEISAPDRVEMMDGSKTLTVAFAGNTPVDTSYFWSEGDPESKRLINTQLEGYRVELNVWGYNPTEELFEATGGAITDAKLEQMDGLDAAPLNQVILGLYRYNYETGKYERYMTDTSIRTVNGRYLFEDGLPRGKYYLVETNLGEANKDRYFNMYNSQDWRREFTVNASERNVVNVYNPEKPNLEITKRVLAEKAGGKHVDLAGLTLTFKDGGTKYTRIFNKDSADETTVRIDNMAPGAYTITESGQPQNTSIQYFGVYNQNQLIIGFSRTKNGSTPQIQKRDKLKTYPYESQVSMELYNPQKGSLKLIKTDAEDPEVKLAGAEFKYSYLPFNANKGDIVGSKGEAYVVRQPGLVDDATLLQDLAGRKWGTETAAGKTNADGELLMEHLDPGWYRITETNAPEGYTAGQEPFYMAVVADMGADHTVAGVVPEAVVTNPHDVSLTVTKNLDYAGLTDHKNVLPDTVTFRLYKGTADGALADTGRSVEVMSKGGHTGIIDGIPQLTAKETVDGVHYYLAETVEKSEDWNFVAAADNQDAAGTALNTVTKGGVTYIELPGFTTRADVAITVTNRLARADITLLKVDKDSNAPLAGAVFALYATDQTVSGTGLPADSARIGTFADLGQGIYRLTNIPAGSISGTDYYVFEVTAPEHYVRKAEPVKVTVLPGQHLSYETPENAGLLTIQNESGVDISLIKHPDVYGGPEAGTIQKSGVKFDLYVRDTAQDGSGWTKVGETREPDADGTIKWTGLKLADRQYALYEYDITGGTYENYALDGIYLDGVKMEETAEQDGRRLYVLAGMSAGQTFGFEAYNRPAQLVTIQKTDANGGPAPEAEFQILDANGGVVMIHGQEKVQTARVGGENYTQVKIPLKAGTYTLVETKTGSGYNLIPDDSRVITRREITVPGEANNNTYEFSNLRIAPTVELNKQVAAVNGQEVEAGREGVLENLWWNDGQTVRYELTPVLGDEITGKGNNGTIERFALTDTGLTMQGPDGNDLAYDIYTRDNYSFTELVIPMPSHDSFIVRDGVSVEAGAITATVTTEHFDGSQNTYEHTFDLEDSWTLDLGAEAGVKGFTVTYEDARMKEQSGYALGQNFNPGTIRAEAVLYQQPYNSQAVQVIGRIRNSANVAVKYSKYLSDGTHQEYTMGRDSFDDVRVLEPDIPTVSTRLDVANNTRPADTATGNIKVGDKLTYTMTLENVSGESIRSEMVGPVFVNRLPIGVNAVDDTVKVRMNGTEIEPDQISVIYDSEGIEYLVVSLPHHNLTNGDKVVVTFEAEVGNAVINNTGAATDSMYVTSRLTKDIFASNPGGATFKWQEEKTGTNWPNEYPDINDIAKDTLGLWNKANGYTYNYRQNTFNTNSDITLLKEGKGNLDSAFVSEPVSAKVTPDENGSIIYHLIAKNTSAEANKTVITRLRLADSLPRPSEMEDFKGTSRSSQWRFNVDGGTAFTVYKVNAEGAKTVIEPENYRIYYFTGDGETAMDQSVLKKYENPEDHGWVLQDNWTGTNPVAVMADITLPEDQHLKTGESAVLEFKADVQEINSAQELERIAYTYAVNRFSMSYYHMSNENPEELAFQDVTSNMVQAVLTPARVGVGGRIWIDANGNGLQDDDQYGTSVSDLQKLVENQYFRIRLNTSGEEKNTVSVASVSQAIPAVPNETAKPSGVLDRTGRFLFSGLLPAQPHDEENLYAAMDDDGALNTIRNELKPGALKGLNPQTNRLTIITGGDGSADIIPGMYLKKTATTVNGKGISNAEGGMSRKPSELKAGTYPSETQDNNFVTNGTADSYVSEQFFLWGDTENWDQTKDFGLIPYRDLTITKYGEGDPKETLEGAEFALYGPFDNEEEARAFDTGKADEGSGKFVGRGATGADGTLKFEGLYYYLYYVIVEESTPDDYMTYGAVASSNIRPMSADRADASWYIPWGVTEASVTNKYGDGTLKVTKADSETGAALAGARFELTASRTNVEGAWENYLAKAANSEPDGLTGVQAVTVDGTTLRFTIAGSTENGATDGTAVLTELPYGTYTLTEIKAPDGYILGSAPEVRVFTISRADRTISYTTDQLALENDAMGPIANTPHETTVVKVSKSNTETKLAGAEFILKSQKGYVLLKDGSFDGYVQEEEKASRFTTDENGAFVIKRLPAGTYTLVEKTAPSGYQINSDIPSFTTDGTKHSLIQVEDQKITHSGGNGGGGGGGGSTGKRSVTVINDENVPLANLPQPPVNETIILDDDVPLAGLPKTGEIVNAAAGLAALISTALMGVYLALQKKRRPDR